MFFRSWGEQFRSSNIALHAVCLPGRCHRINEPFCGVHDAAECVVKIIEQYHDNYTEEHEGRIKWAKVPTYIYGHCLGSIIGFEVG